MIILKVKESISLNMYVVKRIMWVLIAINIHIYLWGNIMFNVRITKPLSLSLMIIIICEIVHKRKVINRGPHQDLSDFLYSGSTDENQWILFYFQLYALEKRSWMLLKLFLFSENYSLVKIFVFFGHTYLCFFQI